jgi:hypothetical protein
MAREDMSTHRRGVLGSPGLRALLVYRIGAWPDQLRPGVRREIIFVVY